MFIVLISSGGLLGFITSSTFSLTISRLWYLFEMELVNQPRGVREPTHVVPITPCHDVYSSLQHSHHHRHCHRQRRSVEPMPIYDHLIEIQFRRVVAISCKWIYAKIRLLWSRLQPGDTLTHGHVCACLCCFNSYTFGIVMPLLICVRYRYSILVDIWLISTPGALRLLAGIDNEYKIYFSVFPYGVNGQ